MKFWKILHKPTGLYWKPRRNNSANLSKDGKAYTTKPSIRYIGNIRKTEITHVRVKNVDKATITDYAGRKYIPNVITKECRLDEFEIVEFDTK